MKWLDSLVESKARGLAQQTSRRGFLGQVAAIVGGGAALVPLLPVARGEQSSSLQAGEKGDPNSCDYWRYCAIDGFLCNCCGGTPNSCPPGTEMSPITWIGTCENPVDGKHYLISYNDCCGKSSCGSCLCQRNEGDLPVYRPQKANDLNWCLGTKSAVYNCSTAVVVGKAPDK
ncbi:MAG TPA: methylamine dehydrogenase light chain [Woeseiaceae bacterium]|nr:methylamine dehydrogenase light chain [Woeseiaceae bacterium]